MRSAVWIGQYDQLMDLLEKILNTVNLKAWNQELDEETEA